MTDILDHRDPAPTPEPAERDRPARGERPSSGLRELAVTLLAALAVLALVVAGLTVIGGSDDGDGSGSDAVVADGAGSDADDAAPTAADDKGLGMLGNGHHDDMVLQELDAATQAELDAQLAITLEVVERYPTLGDAIDDGFTRAGPYSPGLGIHYLKVSGPGLNADGVMDPEDLRNPLAIIFDGTERDAKIAGFMYYSMSADEPEGFAGPNDFWHYHTDVCNEPAPDGTNAPFGADRSVTKEQCDSVGGTFLEQTTWMTHVWTVPGYELTDEEGGVFGEVNPALTCSDGTYYVMDQEFWPDHPKNVCRSELT